MLTEQNAIASARTQYRAVFKTMAASGVRWNLHRGSANLVLLREGATMDVPLPLHVQLRRLFIVYRGERITIQIEGV